MVQGDRYRITVLTDGLLRLEYAEDGEFEDRPSAFALYRDLPPATFEVRQQGEHLEIVTDRLHLVYDRGPFSTSGLSVQVRGNVSSYHSVWRYGEPPDDLGGTARTLDNADGAVPLEPGVASRWGFAVLDDSRTLVLDERGWPLARNGSRTDLYFFGYGHDYPAAVRALYAVSGPTPLLPRFALGNWWSRYHPYTADGYRALMERFRQHGTPFAVSVLDMDWHLVDVDASHGSGWTGYTWNRELIPDPEELLDWLHRNGLRVTLNVHPADGVRVFEDAYPAMAEALGRDPAGEDPIAFDVTDEHLLAAYFGVLHRGLEDQGVDFWWVDWQSGPHSRVTGIDPLWVLNHFHFLDSARVRDGVARRPLTFSRYAGPGSHRYPVGFSGDALITWDSLAFQPGFTAAASNIGYGWWSHDIGGHMFGVRDDELTARWVQFGAFSPVLRLHSGSNPFITKEPWSFDAEVDAVITRYLRLRHRLVPYLHTMNHRAARDGTPLVQPMYWTHPERPEAYTVPQQYWFGSELLAAPITAPADPAVRLGAVRAWLPPGDWVDIFTGQRYVGDREIVLHRELGDIPVLARAGAIIPLDAAGIPDNDPVNPPALELLLAPGADGSFELIEDDGSGDGLDERSIARTPISFQQRTGIVRIGPASGGLHCLPERRSWTVTVLGGAPGAPSSSHAVTDVPVAAAVEIDVGPDPQPPSTDLAAFVFRRLDRAQIEHELKTAIHAAATSDRPVGVRLSQLQAMGLPRNLETAVAEILTAEG